MLTYINTDAAGLPATIDENGNVVRRQQSNSNSYLNFPSAVNIPTYPNVSEN